MSAPPAELDLDLRSAGSVRDPFPTFRWLRENEPLRWSPGLNGWMVTRYEDVLRVFNRPEDFSSDRFRKLDSDYASERPDVKAVGKVLGDWLVFRDPPDHTRLRALLQRSFTPRQLEKNRERIQSTIDDLLDRALERREFDFIADFAFPLPAMVIALLLGAPAEDIDALKGWSDRLASYLGGASDGRDNFAEARDGVERLVEYFTALLGEKRREPRDDLMSLMLRAEHDGDKLTPDEVVSNCVLLLFAGHETTTNLLGNGLYHLLHNPAQREILRRDRRVTPDAVEELLRYDGPVPATAKVAARELEWHDRTIRKGQMVIPFIASANRDPRQFDAPDELDIGRRPGRHLGFGFGIHFCLGAPLARLEAQLAFDSLLRRAPELSLAEEPRWKPMIFLRGLESLSLRV
jgi:cytochrome P450